MAKNKNKEFMGTEPIGPLLRKLSIPAMIGMLANAFYNIVDTIFVGQGVGTLGIAGISIAFPAQMLIGAFATAFGLGAASIASRKLGEKDEETAAQAAGNAMILALVTAFIISVLGLIYIDSILQFLGASPAILPYSHDYLSIIFYGAFFVSFSMCTNHIIRSEGSAKAAMIIMMSGMVLNIILDPIFIFAFHLGIKGAAYATVISQIVSSIIGLMFFLQKRSMLHFTRKSFILKWKLIKETILLGASAFIRQLGTSIIAVLVNKLLGIYGGDLAITSYGMINKIAIFFLLPSFGVNQGLQPIAGYNYGAQFYPRVKQVLKLSIFYSSLIGLTGSVLSVAFPRTLLQMFTSDIAVLDMATPALRIIMSTMVLIGIQACGATYFQAVGKSLPAILLGLSRQFIILIPALYLLSIFFGLNGIWFAFPVSDLLATIITLIITFKSLSKLGKE